MKVVWQWSLRYESGLTMVSKIWKWFDNGHLDMKVVWEWALRYESGLTMVT